MLEGQVNQPLPGGFGKMGGWNREYYEMYLAAYDIYLDMIRK